MMRQLPELDLIKLLKEHFAPLVSGRVYLDVVPDNVSLPAVTLTSLSSSPIVNRDTSGRKMGDATEHRIGLIATSMAQLNELVKCAELLDNTESDYFNCVRVDFGGRDPWDGETSVYRVFYNLTAVR